MTALPKQFAIINKIKNLVKKTSGSFWKKSSNNAMTDTMAKRIQKAAFEMSQEKSKDTYTPAYIVIADQLQVDDEQIFQAAVYNLTKIAMSAPQNADKILAILNTYKDKESKSQFEHEYVYQKIAEIKSFLSSEKKKKAS